MPEKGPETKKVQYFWLLILKRVKRVVKSKLRNYKVKLKKEEDTLK